MYAAVIVFTLIAITLTRCEPARYRESYGASGPTRRCEDVAVLGWCCARTPSATIRGVSQVPIARAPSLDLTMADFR